MISLTGLIEFFPAVLQRRGTSEAEDHRSKADVAVVEL